jgi:hypothetical protein
MTRRRHHARPAPDPTARREGFQISPQLAHRQYAFSSGVRAVVEIDLDLHAGHAVGVMGATAVDDRPVVPFQNSYDFMRPSDQFSRRRSAPEQRVDNRRDDANEDGRNARTDLPAEMQLSLERQRAMPAVPSDPHAKALVRAWPTGRGLRKAGATSLSDHARLDGPDLQAESARWGSSHRLTRRAVRHRQCIL